MRSAALLLLLAPGLAACATPETAVEAASRSVGESEARLAAIEAAMRDSAVGWNTGDMDRFLAIYSRDPRTSFVGSRGVTRGVAEMEAVYRAGYDWSDPDPSQRGVLTLATLDFRDLGDGHALYIGRYTLTYPDGRDPVTGPTSLVFRYEADGWKIIADHSS